MSGPAPVPWEERPPGSSAVVWRSERNPIIARDQLPRSNSIFNSAVVPFGDGFAGVFRVDDTVRTMNLHAGFSRDGVSWDIDAQPIVFEPADDRVPRDPGIVHARLRPPRHVARRPLVRDLVRRLPRADDRGWLDPGLPDVPAPRQCVPAVQSQRRPVSAADRRLVRHAQPAERQRSHRVRGHLPLAEPGPGPLGPPPPRDGDGPLDVAIDQGRRRSHAHRDSRGLAAHLSRCPDVVQRVRVLDGRGAAGPGRAVAPGGPG